MRALLKLRSAKALIAAVAEAGPLNGRFRLIFTVKTGSSTVAEPLEASLGDPDPDPDPSSVPTAAPAQKGLCWVEGAEGRQGEDPATTAGCCRLGLGWARAGNVEPPPSPPPPWTSRLNRPGGRTCCCPAGRSRLRMLRLSH